jgi:hypothetical protein
MRTLFLGGLRRLRSCRPRLAGGRWVGWLLVLACLAALALGLMGCTGPSEQRLREIYAQQPPGEIDRARTALLDTDVNAPRTAATAARPAAAPTEPPAPPTPLNTAPPAMPALARSQKPDAEAARPAPPMPPPPADGQLAVKIVARVDDVPILEQELREATYHHLGELIRLQEPARSQRRKEVEQQELQLLIERELVMRQINKLQKARPGLIKDLEQKADEEFNKRLKELKVANGFTSDEQLKAALDSQGMTLDGMRRQVRRSYMMKEFVEGNVMPVVRTHATMADVREYYDQHPQEFRTQDRVVWQDLFLDAARYGGKPQALQLAGHLATQVRSDADFVGLVERYDCGDSRLRKGTGTGEQRGEIRPPQIEPVLFEMQPGQMRVIEFDSGLHLVRLAKRTYAGTKPYDEATQGEARRKLQQAVFEREYRRLIDELRRPAAIVITADP